ncbi:hypothetical protein KCU98_g1345, partial [Aureobasidium melanogenum]
MLGQNDFLYLTTALLRSNRRERGFAGSAISFGAISEVGYVERRSVDINLSQKMSNSGYAAVSEWDYHQFFAEALKEQTTKEGVQKVLLDCFISGLCTMLHIRKDESTVTPETGLTELGIDPFGAVQIRSWF